MYKNNTYRVATSLDMIIWLSIGKKHNSLAKFGQGYREIKRERMEEEGEGNICIFVLKGYFGNFTNEHSCLKNFH